MFDPDEIKNAANVRNYGARGDGADDTAAFKKAVKAACSGSGAVYIPAGDYSSDCIRITEATNDGYGLLTTRLKIFGDGHSSRVCSRGAEDLLWIGNPDGTTLFDIKIADFRIDGKKSATSCLRFSKTHRVSVSGMRIDNSAGSGIVLDNSSFGSHVFSENLIRDNFDNGIYIAPGVADNGNATKLIGNTVLKNGGSGVSINAGVNYLIMGNDISSNGNGGVVAKNAFALSILGNYFEDHITGEYKTNVAILGGTNAVTVLSNEMFVYDHLGQESGVFVEPGVPGISCSSNFFFGFAASATALYLADGTYSDVTWIGNVTKQLASDVRRGSGVSIARLIMMGRNIGSGIGPLLSGVEVESSSSPEIMLRNPTAIAGYKTWSISSEYVPGGATKFSAKVDGAVGLQIVSPLDLANGDTALLLAVKESGISMIKKVYVGDQDSAGSGFRFLKVEN